MLLNRQEIDKIEQRIQAKGLTIVPLSLYFKDGRAKVDTKGGQWFIKVFIRMVIINN